MRRLTPMIGLVLCFEALMIPLAGEAKELLPFPEKFESARVVNLKGSGLPSEAKEPLHVSIDAYEMSLALDLIPARLFTEDAKTIEVRDDGEFEVPTVNYSYEGTVYGIPDAAAHLTLVGDSLKGVIMIGSQLFFVDPGHDFSDSAQPGDVIVSRAGENPLPEFSCEVKAEKPELKFSDSNARFAPLLNAPLLRIESTRLQYRLDVGLVGDSSFVLTRHGGNDAAARADMDAAVNSANLIFRSIPVSMKIGGRRTYASRAAEITDGVAPCPAVCLWKTASDDFGSGTRCVTNSDCPIPAQQACTTPPSVFRQCSGGILNGVNCNSTAECGGGTCTKTCDSVFEGLACTTDNDCAPGITCGRSPQLCAWGTDVGEVCQTTGEGCSTFGNCCADPAACKSSPLNSLGWSVGHHREANVWTEITTSTTDTVHRFTACNNSFGWAQVGNAVCGTTPYSISSTNPSGAESAFGTFSHEMGHQLGANHDRDCSTGSLKILPEVCSATSQHAGKMCEQNSQCGTNGDCNVLNERVCSVDGVTPCADAAADCGSGTCDGPANRLCVGGTNPGVFCIDGSSTCKGGGTCTGAPMNYEIYPMSGSGTWGGFSPCSQKEIGNKLDASAAACLLQLPCGDVQRNDGAVTASDANAALQIAVGSLPYDDLANVMPLGSPDNVVTTADALRIQAVAVGTYTVPTVCGRPDFPYRWINNY